MIAVALNEPQPGMVQAGLDGGILINAIADRTMRLLPPLTLTDAEADELVAKAAAIING